MTKTEALAKFDAAIAVRYAARDKFLASGAQADLDALNTAVKAQDEASIAFQKAK